MTTLATAFTVPGDQAITHVQSGWMKKLLSNRVSFHVLFWMFVFGFNAAYIAFIGEDRAVSMYNLGLRIPFILACCYINLYFLMPRFYHSGKLLLYGALVLILIFVTNGINLFFLEGFVDTPICPTTFEADATFNGSNYVYKSFYLFSIVGLTSGIKLSKDHFAGKQKAEAIEKEKLQTELSLLKSQIHPHFFFNTLNNLYALTIKRSELAPDTVLKLSDLMSYSLYESDGDRVSLERELKHIQNYIELESLRLTNKLSVEFKASELKPGTKVPPLIFLPLIENCFKHVAATSATGVIRIEVSQLDRAIVLRTTNPARPEMQNTSTKGGLGLKNVRRRLDLLYGSNYRLETSREDNGFTAVLEIPVS